jgi:site-specific DNA recombinase
MVRQMYRWIDEEGLSIQKVVVRLNQSGISPRKRGQAWQKSSVRRILRSEVYAGTWYYNKHQHCLPQKRSQNQQYRKSQTSLRLRPRSEWLPVKLPQNLRIIDPAQWRRVQEQLDRNIAFSPRNQRHSYLLTGLLRCGGCKAAYVGEPQHSRFAYRCSRRCKKYGSISEAWLNTTVWDAFSAALRNPKIIAEAIKETSAHAQVTASSAFEHEEIERGLKQIQAEEARILEAYRLEILSAQQLGRELDSLRARLKVFQSRQATLPKEMQVDETAMQRSLDEYCKLVRARLTKLNRDERQRLLRLLLKSVIFEGERVRIQAIIPFAGESPHPITDASMHHEAPIRIASTTSYGCARNDELQPQEFLAVGSRPRPLISFELVAKVERDCTARHTASLRNLIKANEARKKLRKVG